MYLAPWHFNSQPHKEADFKTARELDIFRYFNSQPHKEADVVIGVESADPSISTHSLTRRLTVSELHQSNRARISTHSLTRRLTICSTPCLYSIFYFNSQPHKEADAVSRKYVKSLCSISTHSLTRRLTETEKKYHWRRWISTHSLTRRLTSETGSQCG